MNVLRERAWLLAAWWIRLGGAINGDAPHPYAAEYPWTWSCWCDRPEEHPVHDVAGRLTALREADGLAAERSGRR